MFIIRDVLGTLYYEGECIIFNPQKNNSTIKIVTANENLHCNKSDLEDANIDSVIADLIMESINSYPLKSRVSIMRPKELPFPHNDDNSIRNLNTIYNKIVAMLKFFDSPEVTHYASGELSDISVQNILLTYLKDDYNIPQQNDIEVMLLELSSKLYSAFSKYFEQRGTLVYDALTAYVNSSEKDQIEKQPISDVKTIKLK